MHIMGIGFRKFCKFYWKITFAVVYPIVLMPIFICNNTLATRCMFSIALMGGLWLTEALPLPVTSLIPMVLFPLMGILNSDKTSECYFKETNMMFVAGIIVTLAVEYCNLHIRISLMVIKSIGCSARRLNLGLMTATMLLSMWISNTEATAMMIPIIDATLAELEAQGCAQVYENVTLEEGVNSPNWENRRPTNATICYYLGAAYAASIGGLGTLLGSGTNMAFKGIYEDLYPESPGIDFGRWMFLMVPMMIVLNYVVWFWLQIWFMGLFRPKSKDALAIDVGPEGADIANHVIGDKLDSLGKMTFHEKAVAVLFLFCLILWCTRKPEIVPGWAEVITTLNVKGSTAALIVVMIMFIIPAHPDFIYMFSDDKDKQPKGPSSPLITWKYIQSRMPWGLMFLLGGAFALAEASENCGMSSVIAHKLRSFTDFPAIVIMILVCLLGTVMTQFSANVAVAAIILPVLSDMAKNAEKHPLTLMLPAATACSFAYCLPVSTLPNAIASKPCNLPTSSMCTVGVTIIVISLVAMWCIFPFLAPIVFDMYGFPDWAKTP